VSSRPRHHRPQACNPRRHQSASPSSSAATAPVRQSWE
jgi:hypothetical protein